MKKLLYILLLLPSLVFGQTGAGYTASGEGYINYKSYKTHYGTGASSTYNGVTYNGGANSTAEFDAFVDTNQPGTTLTHVGQVSPLGSTGLNGGHPPKWGGSYFAIVFSGWFKPNKSGTYNIRTLADDSSESRYREVGTTEWQTMTYQWGCCSYVYGTATLDNTKWYEFEFRYQEYGGGDYYYFEYSLPANSSSPIYNRISTNHQFGTWTNVEPDGGSSSTDPEVDLDLEFHSQLAPEQYRFKVYYDGTSAQNGTEWLNTSTMNSSYYLDDDGSKDVTDYLNLVKIADGLKATTISGQVEWVVLYPYDATNNRHQILIDGREFTATNPDTDPNELKELQLLDLYDGPITIKSVSAGSGGWQQYYIPGNLTSAISNSSYGSGVIRNAGSYFGIRAEFTFVDNEKYKGHKVGFINPSTNIEQWTAEEFMDDYITVADVIAGFSELAGGGINGGFKGDLNGVQLQNSDVNQDGEFDFQDTQIGLAFLTGGDTPFNGWLSEIMRIVPKSEYDGTTTSNWKTQTNKGASTSFTFSVIDTIQTLEYKVSFIGDVNLSHSAAQSAQASPEARLSLSKQSSTSLEVDLGIEKTEEHIIITLDLPENSFNIIGSEFRIGFDNERVEYDKLETTSTMNSFDAERSSYIKIGSISTDGSLNLNEGVQYKVYFKPIQSFDSTLGLVSVKKSEVVDINANTINVIIK